MMGWLFGCMGCKWPTSTGPGGGGGGGGGHCLCWGHYDVPLKWVTSGDPGVPTYGYTFGEMSSELGLIFLQLGSNQHISSDFGNQRYLIGVIDTGCICRVMRLPPRDYCNGWLGMGDNKILGGGSIQMGLHRGKFLRHGACLVLSSPLEMGGLWRSSAAHPRQNLVQCHPHPPRVCR